MRPETSAKRTNQNHRHRLVITVICLTLLTIYVAPKLAGLHDNAHVGYSYNANIEWLQPRTLNQQFPLSISNTNWHFDFVDIESILWLSKVDTYGELVIDAETLSLLERVSNRLPNTLSESEWQRLDLLINKSMPVKQAQQLASLLSNYQAYQQNYTSSLELINIASVEKRLVLLQAEEINLERRQQRYFGINVATKLFSKKNLTTSYLNQRRITSMMPGISISQKTIMLEKLNNRYKNAISAGTHK
jgi:hypothetical protein